MAERRVPRIRFKGFEEDWEQRNLLDCIQKITDFRGRTPKKLGMDWSESGYLALSALNVKDGYIDFSQDVHYGNQALYDKWMSGNELHEGQVLFTTEAPMGNVAQVPDNKRYILSQRTIAFDVKENIITEKFLAILLRSTALFNTLTSLSSGGTAKGVSQKSLAGVDVQIPMNLNEQTLLADYFRNLDHLITLHQRKLEKLKILKKAMLEKTFPQNGAKVPEIRFSGFTYDWEQRKFSEVVEIGSGMDYKHLGEGDIPVYGTGGYMLSVDKALSEDKDAIGIGRKGTIDKPYILRAPFWTVDTLFYCVPRDRYDLNFSSCLFQNVDWKKKNESTGVPSLSKVIINNVETAVSSFDEQKKIGEFFADLDNFITLHQRKLEKLRQIKKSMLERMFV